MEQTQPDEGVAEAAAPKKEAKPKLNLQKQNGITQPRPGSKTRHIWDSIFGMMGSLEAPMPYLTDVIAHPDLQTSPKATIQTQYNSFRKFYGLAPVGRRPGEKRAKKTEEAAAE